MNKHCFVSGKRAMNPCCTLMCQVYSFVKVLSTTRKDLRSQSFWRGTSHLDTKIDNGTANHKYLKYSFCNAKLWFKFYDRTICKESLSNKRYSLVRYGAFISNFDHFKQKKNVTKVLPCLFKHKYEVGKGVCLSKNVTSMNKIKLRPCTCHVSNWIIFTFSKLLLLLIHLFLLSVSQFFYTSSIHHFSIHLQFVWPVKLCLVNKVQKLM